MRLTLRTLLAWLDGIVPPGEREDLAKKIAGSQAAETVIERIRAVVDSPTVDAVKIDARGLAGDANSVAEYLTNELAADSVAAFERICIESDAHLAEVASCHRLLAGISADRSLLDDAPDDLVARLCSRVLPSAAETPREPETPTVSVVPPRPAKSLRGRWPSYASLAAAVALLAALAIGLGWSVWRQAGPGGGPPPLAGPGLAGPGLAGPGEDRPVGPSDGRADPGSPATAPPPSVPEGANVPPVAAAAPAVAPAVATVAPPAAAPVAADREPPPEAASTPPPAAVTTGQPPRDEEAGLEGNGDGKELGEAGSDSAAFVAGAAPLILRERRDAFGRDPSQDPSQAQSEDPPEDPAWHGWEVVKPDDELAGRQDLLVPPGFTPKIAIGPVTVHLDQSSRVVLSHDADGVPSVEVVFGRVALTGCDAGMPLVVQAGGLCGRSFAVSGGPIVIEVDLERSAGEGGVRSVHSRVAFPRGGGWKAEDPASRTPGEPGEGGILPPGTVISVERPQAVADEPGTASSGQAEVRLEEGAAAAVSLGWIATGRSEDPLVRSAAAAMADRSAGQPVSEAVESLLADGRAENRVIAAATLAVLGEYGPLMRLLVAEEPGRRLPGTLWEGLERSSVRLALARGVRSAERLRGAVEAEAPPETAELITRLMEGFSDDELAAGGDRTLVEALDHPALVVRRFAAARLFEIARPSAANRMRFRPDAADSARAEGVRWWRLQLEKGLIRRDPAGGLSKPADE